MGNYPDGDYLPANCCTLPITILCPVCGRTAHAVTLTREDGEARYLCGVSHDPRGTCVFRFVTRCVRSGEARQIQFFRMDADGTPHAHAFATFSG